MACILSSSLLYAPRTFAANAQPGQTWGQQMAQELNKDANAAEKEMRQAGQELKKEAESLWGDPAPKRAQPAVKPVPKVRPQTPRQNVNINTANSDPRAQALQGSPETGYAGTWKDRNGDIMTSVIAPAPQPNTTQNYPMVIEPVVNGSDWYAGNNTWNPVWNGQNTPPPSGWPQWPGYPGDPGYAPPPPPPGPGMRPVPPGVPPNQPYNPYYPTHNPYNPSWTPFPPPEHPGYRPLRPNPPPAWKPGQPGPRPNNPGWRPNTPPRPGVGPGPTPPNNGWQPGPPPNQGWRPNIPPNNGFGPGFKPLPMRPGGQTWGGGGATSRSGTFGTGSF